ncbi:MAG: hypothetical protein QW307_02150 [Thermoplasmata archaeon]
MKKILLILIFTSFLISEDLKLSLLDYSSFVSSTNKINVIVDETLKNEIVYFIINDKDDFSISSFTNSLKFKGFKLTKIDNIYYISKDDNIDNFGFRELKLNFIRFDDIQNLLKLFKDIKFEFVKSSNNLVIYSSFKDFQIIKTLISNFDKFPKQQKLKITIIETNLNDIKEKGVDTLNLNIDSSSNLYFNLLTYPFSVTNVVDSNKSKGFYTFLKLLNSKKVVKIHSNPIISLFDNQSTFFSVGSNVPFKTSSTEYQDTISRTSSTVDYKDIGTEISVFPQITENSTYLKLDLKISSLLDLDDYFPITNKKQFNQMINLKKDTLYFLTGINNKQTTHLEQGIPLLKDIPYLGWLFKYKSDLIEDTNLTIVLELIEDEIYQKEF